MMKSNDLTALYDINQIKNLYLLIFNAVMIARGTYIFFKSMYEEDGLDKKKLKNLVKAWFVGYFILIFTSIIKGYYTAKL